MGWRFNRRWDLPAVKREPYCDCQANKRASPTHISFSAPPRNGQQSPRVAAICWETLELRVRKKAQGNIYSNCIRYVN